MKKQTDKINASDIDRLLAQRHADDVFVPECNMGSAWFDQKHRRMDAWVMKKTWSPITMIGYEIKVAKADFRNDEKWPEYLKACNQFYFVCPWGLIDKDELPPEAGLLYVTKTGNQLIMKKKSVWRDIEIPARLLVYVLMARVVITRERVGGQTREQYWQSWLEKKIQNENLGYLVSRRVRDYVEKVETENNRLKKQMEAYDVVRERLTELGFDPDVPISQWNIRGRLDSALEMIPEHFQTHLFDMKRSIEKLIDDLKELDSKKGE